MSPDATVNELSGSSIRLALARSFAGKMLVSKKSMTASGKLVLWIMKWDILMKRAKDLSQGQIPLPQKCNLCIKNNLLPMCPEYTQK